MLKKISCMIFRGGTSKGVFFTEDSLPMAGPDRDGVLLRIMGSPDIRQIDGLGGAVSTTSKVAIIEKAKHEDADIDYTFAQVAIDKPIVDYKGNCGNISSAVGPYAIEMGFVRAVDPETIVRIYNTNTKKMIYSHVQTPGGLVAYDGDYAISGVPGTAAKVVLGFKNPAGSVTGKLLPTGSAADILEVEGLGKIEASIVDVSNPLVFVRAADLGLTGKELPEEIDSSREILDRLEAVRGTAAERIGFVKSWRTAAIDSPAVPKMTIISDPAPYMTALGERLDGSKIDLLGRMMSMQRTHKTYALTGALCTAAAAVVPGTIVNRTIAKGFDPKNVRIGHPGGIIQTGVEIDWADSSMPAILWAFGYRTARLIMQGTVYYK